MVFCSYFLISSSLFLKMALHRPKTALFFDFTALKISQNIYKNFAFLLDIIGPALYHTLNICK
jgi:hypothetical protein